MADMDTISAMDLPPVARTLLVPLACRAIESGRPDALLRDPRAVDLYGRIGGGAGHVPGTKGLDQLFTVMRARQFDRYARAFLSADPGALVVDIGCGLDTRFFRLDNGQMAWLGLDLPEVIGLRRRLLPDEGRCRTLARSMLDLTWLDAVAGERRPPIFLAEGVFPYFAEADVKGVVAALARRFPGSELAFDAMSPLSLRLHGRSAVLKETGASLGWAVDDPRRLEDWGLRLLGKWRYFDESGPRMGAARLLKYIPALADMNFVLHYRLGP